MTAGRGFLYHARVSYEGRVGGGGGGGGLEWAGREAEGKRRRGCSKVECFPGEEGLWVQCRRLGSYDDEPATVTAMEEYAKDQGYEADFREGRFHHEIYLSDVRRCKPEKLKTVIRQPIKRAE